MGETVLRGFVSNSDTRQDGMSATHAKMARLDPEQVSILQQGINKLSEEMQNSPHLVLCCSCAGEGGLTESMLEEKEKKMMETFAERMALNPIRLRL